MRSAAAERNTEGTKEREEQWDRLPLFLCALCVSNCSELRYDINDRSHEAGCLLFLAS